MILCDRLETLIQILILFNKMNIIITGPESSGKTTMANALSHHFNITLVEEYARKYISSLTKPYTRKDVEHIARKQIEETQRYDNESVVFDTDLLTSIIWYEEKYGNVPPWMLDHYKAIRQTFYLLFTPDIPWELDPQRENPQDRMRLFKQYHNYLTAYDKEFFIIADEFDTRLENALKMVTIKLKGKH